jgi:hypothetical protein
MFKKLWQWMRPDPIIIYEKCEPVCPECTKTCSPDKIWVYVLIFIDRLTGIKYTYIAEKDKLFSVPGWTNLDLTEIDDVCMDKINSHILYRLVAAKT